MTERTISMMVGSGSQRHNERKFTAENVDQERSSLNTVFINENIKDVYHELFDGAQERYNNKQKRNDRKIIDYYEHIRGGKQEKPFHELIVQIGNHEDAACGTDAGIEAEHMLFEYMCGFRKRNPNLRVFAAFLHMDEATPHLHIDFVPYTTESKRGLDTRVSLKQGLNEQGFKGKSKSENEWARWTDSEKEELAKVMKKYQVQWLKKDTHREHLSVLDYKTEQRTDELQQLDGQLMVLEEKKSDLETNLKKMQKKSQIEEQKLNKLTPLIGQIEDYVQKYSGNLDDVLPEPGTLELARNYRDKKIKPFFREMIKTIQSLYRSVGEWKDKCQMLTRKCNQQQKRISQLEENVKHLIVENVDFTHLTNAVGPIKASQLIYEEKQRLLKEQERCEQAEKERERQKEMERAERRKHKKKSRGMER